MAQIANPLLLRYTTDAIVAAILATIRQSTVNRGQVAVLLTSLHATFRDKYLDSVAQGVIDQVVASDEYIDLPS